MKMKAYAKINLGLNITGVREDGYHELASVMLPIDLYDALRLEESETDQFISNITLPQKNTITKAMGIMREEFGFTQHFRVTLDKKIPSQAGLGGGSADAAALLHALNQYFDWRLSTSALADYGARIGADVPFCVYNHSAIVTGIGEKVQPIIDPVAEFYALLVKPEAGVSTVEAYRAYDPITADHPDIPKLAEAWTKGDETMMARLVGNSLEDPAFRLNSQIEPIKRTLIESGLPIALMSGSGSCVFAISRDKKRMEQVQKQFKEEGKYTWLGRLLTDTTPVL